MQLTMDATNYENKNGNNIFQRMAINSMMMTNEVCGLIANTK